MQASVRAPGIEPLAAGVPPIVEPRPAARLPRALLLWLYVIVPIGISSRCSTATLFGGVLRRTLPAVPDDLLLWTLIFNVPHVVASQLLLLDGSTCATTAARCRPSAPASRC